ncbi:MAG: YaaA family protein [Bacillota bacterium]
MKFLISPSKTMEPTLNCEKETILFPDMRSTMLEFLKSMNKEELRDFYGVSQELADFNHERIHNFKENNHALFAYVGEQFKALEATSLDEDAIEYLNDHLIILSAMYGAVRPYDCIGLYRLPMGLKKDGTKLSKLWQNTLESHYEEETLINLASKEYSDALGSLPMIRVDFLIPDKKGGFRKAHAMEAKKMRGLFVRYVAKETIQNVEGLKAFDLEDYAYDSTLSKEDVLVFKRD